jgi:hypothetical protein
MTKKVQTSATAPPKKPAAGSRSAVLAALSLLSASMGLSLNDVAKAEQDVTVNKAKTADKAFRAMDGYIRSRTKPEDPDPTKPARPVGSQKKK